MARFGVLPRLLVGLLGAVVVAWLVYKGRQDGAQFLTVSLNGLTLAALYFVVAAGFTLIFGLMRVVNMAHGALYLLGGYVALDLTQHGMDWWPAALLAALIVGAAGLLMHQALLRWNQGQDLRQALITIAIAMILADQM